MLVDNTKDAGLVSCQGLLDNYQSTSKSSTDCPRISCVQSEQNSATPLITNEWQTCSLSRVKMLGCSVGFSVSPFHNHCGVLVLLPIVTGKMRLVIGPGIASQT